MGVMCKGCVSGSEGVRGGGLVGVVGQAEGGSSAIRSQTVVLCSQ